MPDEELEAIYNEAISGEGKTVFDGLRAVAQAEREACAKACAACEDTGDSRGIERDVHLWNNAVKYCVIAIRGRSNV